MRVTLRDLVTGPGGGDAQPAAAPVGLEGEGGETHLEGTSPSTCKTRSGHARKWVASSGRKVCRF